MARTPGITGSIRGVDGLNKLLAQLPEKMEGRVLRNATNAAARVVAREARAHVPVAEGDLKKSITARSVRTRKGEKAVAAVVGFKKPHSGKAHLVEYGTGPRETSSGASRGAMPAQPFMRPAIVSAKDEVLTKFVEIAAKGVAREAARLAKSGK